MPIPLVRSAIIALTLIIVWISPSYGLHVRSGQIIARQSPDDSLTFTFFVTLYWDGQFRDLPSDRIAFRFGDGEIGQIETEERVFDEANNAVILRLTYVHRYSAPGMYIINLLDVGRNEVVVNIGPPSTEGFYIETKITAGLDKFNSPDLLLDPLDLACTGQLFFHNPGAFDKDGDSLAFRLVVPKRDTDVEVSGYRPPDHPDFGGIAQDGGPATFSMDSITGTIIWDSPNFLGEYNIAFIIEEWRDGEMIGFVTRDMQIVVTSCDGTNPELVIPSDICVLPGTSISEQITALHPSSDLNLLAVSPVFSGPAPAVFTANNPQSSPALGNFSWVTNDHDITRNNHRIIFRAETLPTQNTPFKLTDIKTWQIKVVGPAPTGLKALPDLRSMQLNWDLYPVENAKEILILRRENCDAASIGICNNFKPPGYAEVGRVSASETSFIDNNLGEGLIRGISYSYRLMVEFNDGAKSLPSDNTCNEIAFDAPVMLQVDVTKTDLKQGEIQVEWTQPFELNQINFPPPYQYDLFRADDSPQDNIQLIYSTDDIQNTSFIDQGLNTEEIQYYYNLTLRFGAEKEFIDSADQASSIHLITTPVTNSMLLQWIYNVPWQNNKFYIYRDSGTGFALIATLFVPETTDTVLVRDRTRSFSYFDDNGMVGLTGNTEHCYFIRAEGKYSSNKLTDILINNSQISCGTAIDNIAPCVPSLSIKSVDCENYNGENPIANQLEIQDTILEDCSNDAINYNIYFRPFEEGEFNLLTTVNTLTFIHQNNNQISGCYRVSAVDGSGNESERSEIVCVDNCIVLLTLPNVITPNQDGKNDVFHALFLPPFIQLIHVKIFNRWGKVVFEGTTTENLFWSGKNQNGKLVSNGTYYYEITAFYQTLKPEGVFIKFDGWVSVLR